jgi:rhamnosyltransferase
MSKIEEAGRGSASTVAVTATGCYAHASATVEASMPDVSVIVRARDEEASIGRCLRLIRDQRGGAEAELILVDHASRDGTAAVARAHGATVLRLPDAGFSFGGALNQGAARAAGELLVALSAHAFATDPLWLERLTAAFADPAVACASGARHLPDGSALTEPVRQDAALLTRHPSFGYSNGAGAFRAALWRERPFREDLPGCEDLEWAAHWLARGHVALIDPALAVEHDHTHDPLPAIYRRARREAEGLALFLGTEPQRPGELLADWWGDLRFYDSPLRARLSHRRAARLLGAYAGLRRAARARTEGERLSAAPG